MGFAMTIHRILAWLPLVVLTIMMTVSKLRAFAMHRRGLRVIVVDRHRPWKDVLHDLRLDRHFSVLVLYCAVPRPFLFLRPGYQTG